MPTIYFHAKALLAHENAFAVRKTELNEKFLINQTQSGFQRLTAFRRHFSFENTLNQNFESNLLSNVFRLNNLNTLFMSCIFLM